MLIDQLPEDILLSIFELLEPLDVLKLRQVRLLSANASSKVLIREDQQALSHSH